MPRPAKKRDGTGKLRVAPGGIEVKAIGRVLTSRWFISLIGVILLSAVVWFVGPLISVAGSVPLEDELTRLIVIGVLFLLWGLFLLIGWLRARRANDRMISDLARGTADAATEEAAAKAEEMAVLQERIQDALVQLRQAKLGGANNRQYLYQLPWYILIGPPGSGKTTALIHSGLSFPLADKMGKDAVKGVGGTRNCDWWFTNEAVLIDTAGRYTTQDSHEAVDASAWGGFLNLLKRYRKRQPINGALIAISLSDMVLLTDTERQAHARAIRMRIRELHDQLGVRFPIYVLFTKADLIAGFVEYFDDLGREEREQVWGMTFPLDDGGKNSEGVVEKFGEEFDLLVQRLNDRLVDRVHTEQDMQRRGLIFGFPQQVASLKEPVLDFLRAIFQPSRFEQRSLLRGVYFTSGTQEGTPIDRLMGAMASTFGINRQQLAGFGRVGRSYFLTRLLRGVVFPEAGVVSANRRLERRRVWIHRTAYALALLVLIGMGSAWALSYLNNRDMIDAADRSIDAYNAQINALNAQGVNINRVDDADFGRVRQPLQILRDMPRGYAQLDTPIPITYRFGLYQGEPIQQGATTAYRDALNNLLMPRLLLYLEGQIGASMSDPEQLFAALRVYLMLGMPERMDEEQVMSWFTERWTRDMPDAAARQQMLDHLSAMLVLQALQPPDRLPLNTALIDRARDELNRISRDERAYVRIRQLPEASNVNLRPWTIAEQVPGARDVFVRASGAPLEEGIDGLYTYAGFYTVFIPALDTVAQDIANESWVLGLERSGEVSDNELIVLANQVLGRYLDDYQRRWDRLLFDIRIVPFADLNQAQNVTNRLAGTESPLRYLLTRAYNEIKLWEPPPAPPTASGQAGPATAAANAAVQRAGLRPPSGLAAAGVQMAQRLANSRISTRTMSYYEILWRNTAAGQGGAGGAAGGQAPPTPPQLVNFEQNYRWLRDFVVSPANGPSRLDNLVNTLIQGVYRQLVAAGRGISGSGGGSDIVTPSGGAVGDLEAAAGQMPPLVGNLMTAVANDASTIAVGGVRAQLSQQWQGSVVRTCGQVMGNRFPFAASANDVPLQDFARLFAPGGLIDSFFTSRLAQYVDTSRDPWVSREVSGVNVGIPPAVLMQFRRAADIRDSFFQGNAVRIGFTVTPADLDPTANSVTLEIDGQVLSYGHTAPRGMAMNWPGSGAGLARVAFSPANPGQASEVREDGPWALFRLLRRAQLQRLGADRYNVTFNVGGRSATFELRIGSAINPFDPNLLRGFQCPPSL